MNDQQGIYTKAKPEQYTCHFSPQLNFGHVRYRGPFEQRLHHHPEHYEMHYFCSGNQDYHCGGQIRRHLAGHFSLVAPFINHHPETGYFENCELYWLQFPRELGPLRLGFDAEEVSHIESRLQLMAQNGVYRASEKLHRTLHEMILLAKNPLPFMRSRMQIFFSTIFMETVDSSEQVASVQSYSPQVEATLNYLRENYANNESLERVAEVAEINLRRLQELFKKETGVTLNEYRTSQRISEATRLLTETSFSTTKIAYQLGFSSGQYFSTIFKKVVGCSPSAYTKLLFVREKVNS